MGCSPTKTCLLGKAITKSIISYMEQTSDELCNWNADKHKFVHDAVECQKLRLPLFVMLASDTTDSTQLDKKV